MNRAVVIAIAVKMKTYMYWRSLNNLIYMLHFCSVIKNFAFSLAEFLFLLVHCSGKLYGITATIS
jgi:hypothetical protein